MSVLANVFDHFDSRKCDRYAVDIFTYKKWQSWCMAFISLVKILVKFNRVTQSSNHNENWSCALDKVYRRWETEEHTRKNKKKKQNSSFRLHMGAGNLIVTAHTWPILINISFIKQINRISIFIFRVFERTDIRLKSDLNALQPFYPCHTVQITFYCVFAFFLVVFFWHIMHIKIHLSQHT